MQEFDANQKYQRLGHIHQDRFCDEAATLATKIVPGDGVLPPRWRYRSREEFLSRYKNLGETLWAKTASYHLLMIRGEHVIRIWTDTPDSCIVDVHEILSRFGIPVSDVPASVVKKTRPLMKRTVVTELRQVEELMDTVRLIWLG